MKINLNGRWEFRQLGTGEWMPARVPGSNFGDLLRNKAIPNPYARRNELDTLWVGKVDWEYRRKFKVSSASLEARRQILLCEGLDTVATIYLNENELAETDNMFRRYIFNAAAFLRDGENEIRIVFASPVQEAERRLELTHSPIYSPGLLASRDRATLRKCQCQFGWDWGPIILTSGIWKDISLGFYDAPRITDTVTDQEFLADGTVRIRVKAWLEVPAKCSGRLVVRLDSENPQTGQSEALQFDEGERTAEAVVIVHQPQLWWPNGQGASHLYNLIIEWRDDLDVVADSVQKRIGLRKVELVREADAEGESFFFRVNGRPVYAKGANWIPGELMLERMTREVYERDLRACAAVNMNMVRAWGGGIYEKEEFYDLCDELGLMVWQDFMFACSLYPGEAWFLENVEAEARQQVRRLRDHACVVLWCGNNENEMMMKNWIRRELVPPESEQIYKRLFHDLLRRVAAEEDPWRAYWPSSPSSGGDGNPKDRTRGDIHYWEVWHGGKKFDAFEDVKPRFSSEFGFQSFPDVETLKTVADKEDLNPCSPVMDHHQRFQNGNKNIIEHLSYHLRFPWTFDHFCYASQVLQAMALQTAIEHWRRLKPFCMGALYWQINDCWPVASWSSIDFAGRWKALHYAAKRFFAPLLVSSRIEKDAFELWATSDLPIPLRGRWKVEIWTFQGEQTGEFTGEWNLAEQQSKCVASVSLQSVFRDGMECNQAFVSFALHAQTQGEAITAENTRLFCPPKAIDFSAPQISFEVIDGLDGRSQVRLRTQKPALFVRLSAGNLAGQFSDNYMHLLPGRNMVVSFEGAKPVSVAQLKRRLRVMSLYDSYQPQ